MKKATRAVALTLAGILGLSGCDMGSFNFPESSRAEKPRRVYIDEKESRDNILKFADSRFESGDYFAAARLYVSIGEKTKAKECADTLFRKNNANTDSQALEIYQWLGN